jgi:hypothetical protein
MSVADAQGTTVSWGGAVFSLISFDFSQEAGIADVTSFTSTLASNFGKQMIVIDRAATTQDYGKLSITFHGASNTGTAQVGMKYFLNLTTNGSASLSALALLESISFSGSVGETIKGSAVFVFTGQ